MYAISCKQTHRQQQNPPGVVVGAAVVVGRGEVVTAASSSRGRQSHSHQRIGRHATFMHDKKEAAKPTGRGGGRCGGGGPGRGGHSCIKQQGTSVTFPPTDWLACDICARHDNNSKQQSPPGVVVGLGQVLTAVSHVVAESDQVGRCVSDRHAHIHSSKTFKSGKLTRRGGGRCGCGCLGRCSHSCD